MPKNPLKLKFNFFDGKVLEYELDESELAGFVQRMGAGEIHWNTEKTKAIWIPMPAVRYFEIERIKPS